MKKIQERQMKLIELFDRAPMKHTFGMDLSYDEKNNALFRMAHNDAFTHAMGQMHGGVIMTLLDNAGWFTVAARYSTWVSTAEIQVRILEPVQNKTLIASGRTIKEGKRIAMAEMELRSEDGLLVAVGSGTFAVTSISYNE